MDAKETEDKQELLLEDHKKSKIGTDSENSSQKI